MVSYLARCARGAPTGMRVRTRSVRISSNARLVVFWIDFFGGIGVHDSRELPGVKVRRRRSVLSYVEGGVLRSGGAGCGRAGVR